MGGGGAAFVAPVEACLAQGLQHRTLLSPSWMKPRPASQGLSMVSRGRVQVLWRLRAKADLNLERCCLSPQQQVGPFQLAENIHLLESWIDRCEDEVHSPGNQQRRFDSGGAIDALPREHSSRSSRAARKHILRSIENALKAYRNSKYSHNVRAHSGRRSQSA